MHRSVSNTLKRWSSKLSSHNENDIAHLCKSCQKLTITQNLLKGINESRLPDGSLALDLSQGYVDLPMRKDDQSPEFDRLRQSALSGCEFCNSLLDAIQRNQVTRETAWAKINGVEGTRNVTIRFRYCFGPDPGVGTFDAEQWPFMLAALEALVHCRSLKADDDPIVIAFKIYCDSSECIRLCELWRV
jgi:hypothetical protein